MTQASGGTITILGCGGSGGVPLTGNKWLDCDPSEPKNRRTRASAHIAYDNGKALQIDTGPDFRYQINHHKINKMDAVVYTHSHADHVNGMDELRYFNIHVRDVMPIYAMAETIDDIKRRFDYILRTSSDGLYKPAVVPNIITDQMLHRIVQIEGCPVMITKQEHGPIESLGLRFGSVGYSTDVSGLSQESLAMMAGIDTWIVDCGQYGSDFVYSHPNLDIVRGWNEVVGAQRVILTHLTPRADYQTISKVLPDGYELAYDGLSINFTLL